MSNQGTCIASNGHTGDAVEDGWRVVWIRWQEVTSSCGGSSDLGTSSLQFSFFRNDEVLILATELDVDVV